MDGVDIQLLEEMTRRIEETEVRPSDEALEIGRRGLETHHIEDETEEDRWRYSYFALAKPCYNFVRACMESNALKIIAKEAALENRPPKSSFPYYVPPIEVKHRYPKIAETFHLRRVLGLPDQVGFSRLLFWLAVCHNPPEFGENHLFSQEVDFLSAYREHSGRLRGINRIKAGVASAARGVIIKARLLQSGDSSTKRSGKRKERADNVLLIRTTLLSLHKFDSNDFREGPFTGTTVAAKQPLPSVQQHL